jgi:hypothetical protein
MIKKYPMEIRLSILAELMRGRPQKVIQDYPPIYAFQLLAKYYLALQKYTKNAESGLKSMDKLKAEPANYREQFLYFPRFMLKPFLKMLQGDKDTLKKEFEKIVEEKKYCFEQVLWYKCAYILGVIDEKRFRQQPRKLYLTADLALAKAMQAEYLAHKKRARRFYRQYAQIPLYQKELNPLIEYFVKWRLQTLSK